jgi:hypothetical protein
MCSKAQTTPTAPLVLHHTRIDKYAMKKIDINGQWRNKLILIVIHHFSLVKATIVACVNRAKTVLLALTTAQWCYQNAFMKVNWGMTKNIPKVHNKFSPPTSKLVA